MILEDPRELLVQIAKTLGKLNIPYFVTGGLAVAVWGRPRFTADIDLVIELKPQNTQKLIHALQTLSGKSYLSRLNLQEALKTWGEFNYIHGETGIKVDFWILKNESFDRSRLKRRIAKDVLGEKIYFISPEDLILAKLLWYQESPSSRQLEDAASILKISYARLDFGYLQKWAKNLGVSQHLEGFTNFSP